MLLNSMDHQIWTMVEKRYTPPNITIKGVEIPKSEDKWDKKGLCIC